MKQKIDRLKTGTARISTRTLAMVLSVVMLISAIGTGSVLNANAETITADGISTDAVQAAATEALGFAEDALNAPADTDDADVQAADDDAKADTNDENVLSDEYIAAAEEAAAKQVALDSFKENVENSFSRKLKDDIAVTGADADFASTGSDPNVRSDYTYVHFVGDDLSGSGLDTAYFTSYSGQGHYTGTWYIKNKNADFANSVYDYYVKIHGKVKANDSWNYYLSLNNLVFGTGDGEHNGSSDDSLVSIYEGNDNMTLRTMPTPTGWVALQVNFYGSYGIDNNSKYVSRLALYQSAVPVLTATDKSVTTDGGTGVNVMPTIAGGTGNTTRSYTVRDQYGNTVSDCMSSDTFTPPYVTEDTVYYVDATVTDSNISTLVDTATVTVTVSPKVSTTYRVVGAEGLTGDSWDTTKNYMTQIANDSDKGTFVKTFENVAAGTYDFKIYDDSYHPWNDYGGGRTSEGTVTSITDAGDNNNNNVRITVSVLSNVTITFTNHNRDGVDWTIKASGVNANTYDITVSDADTAHAYSTTIATASPTSAYEGARVTITTSPKAGYVARVSLSTGTATKSGNNFYFTMPASNVTATITYEEAVSIPVTVYANSGGYVNVLYGSAVFTIAEGDHDTIKVNEGDSISLTAVPDSDHSFSKWFKNLRNDYSSTASITEEITTKSTYVASFSGAAGDTGFNKSSYTTEGTGFSVKYNTGNSGSTYTGNSGTALTGTVWRSGDNDYYIELSSDELMTWTTALDGGNQVRWNLFNSGNAQITDKNGYDAQYYDLTTSALKNCEDGGDSTLLIKSKPEDYSSTVFIELSKIDASVGSLGIHINTSTKKVDYYFGVAGGGGSVEYIPSTNYYAKDSAIRNVTGETVNGLQYNFWIFPTKTTVTEVAEQVSVDNDHAANASAVGGYNQWVDGYAMKGSEITVTTVIPHRGSYKTVDRSGTAATKYADEKYYVAGFSFNGVTPELISESSGVSVTGVEFLNPYGTNGDAGNVYKWTGNGTSYTCTYKIPVDMKESMLEITPIIFVKDAYASETVMVYINGYNEEVQDVGWGNTLFMYPFYKYLEASNTGNDGKATYFGQGENFGRYPGQPVINYGGQLFCQIPLTDDASKTGKDNNGGAIKGITINNGYYDYVHRTLCNHVSVHRQTYDYDDFAKIYNEKKTKNGSKYLYSIYFSFKYKGKNPSQQHRLSGTTNSIDADGDASRYNDLLASGNILNDTTGTVAASTLETAGESSGGWEYLRDALGNKVDLFGNKIDADDETSGGTVVPLRVFSLGYEYNNAGRWATEWAVYHKSGDNYELVYDDAWGIDDTHQDKEHNSSIVPSALIYNDQTTLASAPKLDNDLEIKGFAGLYEELETYRGIPVKICYEYDIPDAFNPNNYRCDGRWTYTTVDDFVRSNIKIEYYDEAGELQDDSFTSGTHEGETTGCSAYFTNSEYYGETVSKSEIIDNAKSYTFKAEKKGSYEFVGWYMYDTAGHVSTITTSSMTGDTPRSGNFTLAARFKYVASGTLTISNKLATGQTGRGETYLGITMINGNISTPLVNVNSNTEAYTIGKSYINSNSNYTIRIDIRTVPTGENTMGSYSCNKTDMSNVSSAETRSFVADNPTFASEQSFYDSSAYTATAATYYINVKKDIYNSTAIQQFKAIDYISSLNEVHYTYSVKYNYNSRQYGAQAFTKTGQLTSGQINDSSVVTGTLNKTDAPDKKLTKAFLASIAPHESNFNEKITWNFDDVVDIQSCTYTAGTNTYAISLDIPIGNATTDSSAADFTRVRHGYFTVPYAVVTDSNEEGFGVAIRDDSGHVVKTDDTTFTIDLNYDEYFKVGGNFVTAPTVIYETVEEGGGSVEKERYFKYWEMSTASSKRGDSRVIGKCYYPEFNYRALDNYNIKAVYSVEGEKLDGTIGGESGSPLIEENNYLDLYKANSNTSIVFIGNTRNQWNNSNGGSVTGTHETAGDLIYNDFILSFKPEGNDLFNELPAGSTSCGVVIERVKMIETNSSGTNAKTLQEYAKAYSSDDIVANRALITEYVTSDFSEKGELTLMNRSVDQDNVNTKNRCHYVLPMYNNPTGSDLVGNNQKYLYRAYSYMKIDSEVFVSEKPTYFYMYDIAVA